MKYCTRCKKVYTKTNAENCPKCRRKLIDNPAHTSPVNVVTANGFELERILAALKDADIPHSYQQTRSDTGIQILNSAPAENCTVYVLLSDYEKAVEVLAGIGAIGENDIPKFDEETQKEFEKVRKKAAEEELPPQKAAAVRFWSLIGFFIVLAAIVYLTDFLIALIKPFLGL